MLFYTYLDRILLRVMDKEDSSKNLESPVLPSSEQNANNKIEKLKMKKDHQTKKRKWKPYHKMSWKEKKKAAKNETNRANRVREEMFAKGQAIAPYNTTQFLMDDHNQEEPNYFDGEEDVLNDSPEEECLRNEGYMQQQFTEAYENSHLERLNGLSKSDLVQEYLTLEDKVENLQQKFREVKEEHKDHKDVQTECSDDENNDDYWQKVIVFREEIENLKRENDRLRTENEELHAAVCDHGTDDEQ